MNKRMREILAIIDEKMTAAKDFKDGNATKGIEKDLEKASALMGEIKDLQKEYDLEKDMYEAEKAANQPTEKEAQQAFEEKPDEAVKAFMKAARAGFPKATMTEGTAANGGYTVPEDIQTRIEQYRDAKFSLRQLVRVSPVTTNKGAYTFKKRSQKTGFTKVGEGGKIGATDTPEFERVEWAIDKYAGYLPVTNELFDDTDANLQTVLVEWLGDEARVTDNKNILEIAKTFTAKTLHTATLLADIKKILNVDLGQAYKPTSAIVTNDSGLDILDNLTDKDGKPLLTPNPQDPMKMQLRAGATVVPIKVIPNSDLPDDTTNVPFFIGDMYEAIDLRDRKQISILSTTVGAIGTLNAFEEDLTILRGMLREDVVKRDANALFFATLNTAGE